MIVLTKWQSFKHKKCQGKTITPNLGPNLTVVEEHIAAPNSSELNLKVGDIVSIEKFQGNMFNGYSTGYIRDPPQNVDQRIYDALDMMDKWHKTRFVPNEGIYPSYKVQEVWKVVDFPLFNP